MTRMLLSRPFQALVYPLTVAKKSSVPARERAAQMILKNMREHSETLVQQEFMVGDFSDFFPF